MTDKIKWISIEVQTLKEEILIQDIKITNLKNELGLKDFKPITSTE
jgi:hypothetical protein